MISIGSSKQTSRILVIEDDPDQLALIRQYVSMLGYEVRGAEDGSAGLKILEDWVPDLVLLDLYLPETPGMIVLRSIREDARTAEIPVMIMSTDDTEETTIVCLSSGANEYIVKPIRMAELTLKIQNSLELLDYKRQLHKLNTKLEREKGLLSKYFSFDLVEKILSEEISTELGGSNLPASILFMDIRNSTGIAEKMDPKDFADFLSSLLSDLMDIVFGNLGSVNKLTGDGLLATFGCPVPTERDAYNCVKTAAFMRNYIEIFNDQGAIELPGGEPLRIGIGMATGRIFAGNVGSWRRMEYTVLGDPVNLAARLQDLTKTIGTDIVMDAATLEAVREEVEIRDAGKMPIRGKADPVDVYVLESFNDSGAISM
ncbi:MAG: response regulator [bacterium]|nr:response regulator [bacterium]